MSERLPLETLTLYGAAPDPSVTALNLRMHRPDLVRLLLAAFKQRGALRVEGWSQTDELVAELRSIGIVEARGASRDALRLAPKELDGYANFNARFPVLPREPGDGYFLTGYGIRVRRALIDADRVETA